MSQQLLTRVLSQEIALENILRWIDSEKENERKPNEFPISRGEFISHVLNFIHEEALCFETYRETPKKVHTPKSIRKLEITKPKRRPALFTETAKREHTPHKTQQPLSPISPLYTRINSLPDHTLSPITPSTPQGNTPKSKNFCLGDFISPNRKQGPGKSRNLSCTTPNSKIQDHSGDSKEKKKRINPTSIGQRNSLTFNSENSFNFDQSKEKEEEEKVKPTEKLPKVLPKLQPKEIPPDLEKVTGKSQLNILTTLYINLIQSNRVLNVTSELYFVITLLLCKQYESDYFPSVLFASIHNVVYFSVNCLHKITENPLDNVLNLLDKSTLRLLATNSRVQALDSLLIAKVTRLGEGVVESPRKACQVEEKIVCFDADTDNREHFPSDASFHAFRKQRDMFYELLSTWETNHSADGWSFAQGLGGKVRNLLAMHGAPANFRHLSRLVKSQLLITCTRVQDDYLQENQLSFLTTIPNVNAEKLNRLKTRLVAKDQSTGINAPPTFPGIQEFYKELVLQAQSHIFCTHLRNVFIHELLQLNDTTFETEVNTFDGATQTPQNYYPIVKSLQILAKFIGFIESLPYKPIGGVYQPLSDKLTLEEVEERTWMTPPINLKEKLTTAVRERHLVVVIPWFVEYLAMMDATTLRLPYYEPIFEVMFDVFLTGSQQIVSVCLGWLFEQQHFPSEHFFRYLNTRSGKNEVSITLNVDNLTLKEASEGNEVREGLDSVVQVDLSLLHMICPFLKEFQKLLQYNCGRNGSITSKHITPVTAIENVSTEMNEKRLRLQLQEAFLNSKPSSLRKTLDFLSERIASGAVKTICNIIVPGVKSQALAEKKTAVSVGLSTLSEDLGNLNEVKLEIRGKMLQLIDARLSQLKVECARTLDREIERKVEPGVVALLCSDELPQTVDVCCQIAGRLARERVQQWINTRVNTSVFKEFDMDIEKIDRVLQKERDELTKQKYKSLPTQGRLNIDHIDSDDEMDAILKDQSSTSAIWNPSKLMMALQRRCAHLLRAAKDTPKLKTTREEVANLLQHAVKCHKHRSDLSDISWHHLNQQFVDYFILLCTKQPQIISQELLKEFLSFWKSNNESYLKDLFNRVISVRNTVILMTSFPHKLGETWKVYALFLGELLKEKLLTPEEFEAQCLAIFRENWDSATLRRVCQCLQDVLDSHDGKDRFAFLLGFLADYCTDLDF